MSRAFLLHPDSITLRYIQSMHHQAAQQQSLHYIIVYRMPQKDQSNNSLLLFLKISTYSRLLHVKQ